MTTNYTPNTDAIKYWAKEERPREKLIARGKQILTDAELLAILIGSGSRGESAIALCQRILKDANNDLHQLGQRSLAELLHYKGIGEAKAVSIIAALELGRRRQWAEFEEKQQIKNSRDSYEIFLPILGDLGHEEFWILLLSHANKIKGKERISIGGVAGTVADVKIIFKKSIQNLASAIILCHNHPSGTLHPSQADIELTTKVKQAGQVLDIRVLDHLIVTNAGYYSFADEGLI